MQWILDGARDGYSENFRYDKDILFEHDEEIHGQHRFELIDEYLKANPGDKKKLDGNSAQGFNSNKYSWMKDKMTKQHWETRFDQLMAENLIAVPDDFYSDTLPFDNADTLYEIFNELEEKNLGMIHTMQDKQQALEKLKDEEALLHSVLDKKHLQHYTNKKEIEIKISEVEAQLNMMSKRKKKIDKAQGGSNSSIDEQLMLQALGERIRKVYKDYGFTQEVANKSPLDLLNVSFFFLF